jgi:AcrR family transcriptional regulator
MPGHSMPADGAGDRRLLPLVDHAGDPDAAGPAPARERTDAARNRQRVLAAAADLFAARGVTAVTMDDIATRAGVGKGTLYRRFGDRSGLAAALIDERERELQARILAGPPPLGPGAPPAQRLAAFTREYLTFVDTSLDLVLLSQTSTPGARLRTGSHTFWVTHCRLQLEAANAPDPALRAESLLAALTAEQVRHWRDTGGYGVEQLSAALTRLAETLAT